MEKSANLSKIDALLSVTGRLESSIQYLENAYRSFQEEMRRVGCELQKKTEEIKDAYYLAEMNRQRLVEHCENAEERKEQEEKMIAEIRQSVKDLRGALDTVSEQKDKKTILIVQAIITIFSVIFGVTAKIGLW